jgi:hypothetical protein
VGRGGALSLVPSGALLERITVRALGSGADNRHARDDSAASQALTQGAIVGMKAGGAGGADVIAALISHSTTFARKTAFAQEKYVKKKLLKHCVRFRLVRPTPARVADVLAVRVPDRVCGLRGDGLGALLAAANVRSGCRALVVDDTGGVAVGAAVAALGGVGPRGHPSFDHWPGPAWQHLAKFNLGDVVAAAAALPRDSSAGGLRIVTLRYEQLSRWGRNRVPAGAEAAAEAEEAENLPPRLQARAPAPPFAPCQWAARAAP